MDDFDFDAGYDVGYDVGYDAGYVDQVVGMDMVDNGIMNVEQGIILTEMGYPQLGMAQMAVGQMEIAQGENLMQIGMMENNYGMGYGMGMGMGVIAAEEAALIAAQTYACMGVGCRYPCCVKRCLPGCTLSCCRKQVIINQNFGQKPVVFVQQQNVINPGMNNVMIANNQQVQQIYGGSLYKQDFLVWHHIPNGFVTSTHFVNQPLHSITKLKIKRQVIHNDCYFLKTSHLNSLDHYYGVSHHQQLDWFCAIVWSKLQLFRYNCDLYGQYNGFIEGRLPRKSLILGEWAFRDIVIDTAGLRSYRNRNFAPTTVMNRIPQLWTRFHLIQNGTHLVIKLHHQGSKYQYGIPLQHAIVWIRAFASMMR